MNTTTPSTDLDQDVDVVSVDAGCSSSDKSLNPAEHVTVDIGEDQAAQRDPLGDPGVFEIALSECGSNTGASDKEREYIEHVLECCEAEDGFDIYQLMAFKSDSKENWKDRVLYLLNVVKATFCALTQCVGIIVIMHDFAETGLSTKQLCNPPMYDEGVWMAIYNSQLKLLAFLFSSFLSYFSIDQLMNVEGGMYRKFQHGTNLLNVVWLRVGLSVNVFVTIAAVYGSFVTVFFSDNSLDMILNSVALFFLVELDDMLVKDKDYATVKKYLEAYERRDSYKAATERGEKCIACKMCYASFCERAILFVGWLYTLPFEIVRYVTVAACLVLPVYVGYCY